MSFPCTPPETLSEYVIFLNSYSFEKNFLEVATFLKEQLLWSSYFFTTIIFSEDLSIFLTSTFCDHQFYFNTATASEELLFLIFIFFKLLFLYEKFCEPCCCFLLVIESSFESSVIGAYLGYSMIRSSLVSSAIGFFLGSSFFGTPV